MIAAAVSQIYSIDPLEDDRWPEFLQKHQQATVFHSPEWLRSLLLTYGYKPTVLTTSGPRERLMNGLVFCRVHSWITGRRLVSVPFADHCSPLVDTEESFTHLFSALKRESQGGGEKHIEIRSAGAAGTVALPYSATFCLHRLDLRPSLDELFHRFHESCIHRKILRANRERLIYEEGTSEALLQRFYRLLVITRRRHRLPPPPVSWFRNLIYSFHGDAKIRVASSRQGAPVASILTIRHKNAMTYKYGCSDPQFHRLGAVQLLLWKAIQEAREGGLVEFDMGRTDWSETGLLTFKDRWGAARSTLTYLRYPAAPAQPMSETVLMRVAKRLIVVAPRTALPVVGSILYRHVG